MDTIGRIDVPEVTPSGVFPVTSDYPWGRALKPEVYIHQFGSANSKVEQRFLAGIGAKLFQVRCSTLDETERETLLDFWETNQGAYGAFTYNAPDDDNDGTTPYICRFADPPISFEDLTQAITGAGVTLVEIPSDPPTYTLNATLTRIPSTALNSGLLSQVQNVIPLLKIRVNEAAVPDIFLSDRRCTIGAQLYQARLLEWDGISQRLDDAADQASFVFGNADKVMRDLVNDTDFQRARVEFSLFHVGTGIKLDLWAGHVSDWSFGTSDPTFRIACADGLYQLTLPYPCRLISRTCWKIFNDGHACPAASAGGTNLGEACDKGFSTEKGCQYHSMADYFAGIEAKPHSLRIKDNSTGVWGFGRQTLTSTSLVSDSIYGQVIPEIYTDRPMPVNCKLAMGREESDFYVAVGIVGEGPLGAFEHGGHKLDGQPHHGPGDLGLAESIGNDPNHDKFGIDTDVPVERAAGTAFVQIRRVDPPGIDLSKLSGHNMTASVYLGLGVWMWTGAGTRLWDTHCINPIWIAVNALLKALGLRFADATTCEEYFDVASAIAAAAICDTYVDSLYTKTEQVFIEDVPGYYDEEGQWVEPVGHLETQTNAPTEMQFPFLGILQEQKPLRDWISEILSNCLGYTTNSFAKLKFGIRCNSSTLEAFTEGNILLGSLELSARNSGFNHIAANFADAEYKFAGNAVSLYELDHATMIGGATAPLVLKSSMNLCGAATKSQAARIITTRLREELGGITAAEWRAARRIGFRTTVLALNVEPGMVCSLTHDEMPGGAGEFRVTGWRLNRDYSIDISGETTTDSMYNLAIGPKPADVAADVVPDEGMTNPPPNVPIFKAGKSLGDGTFAPNMYWSADRKHMLIDFGTVAPANRTNWSGLRIWIKAPKEGGGYNYSRVTELIPQVNFSAAADGTLYYYDTIAIAVEDIPTPAETWRFIACSFNRVGQENLDAGGLPLGPGVDLSTMADSPYGLNFEATLTEGTTEGGEKGWIATFTWDAPASPSYIKTRVLIMDEFGAGSVGQLTGEDPLIHDYPHKVGPFLYHDVAVNVRFVLQSGFGDGTWADPDLCPHVHATLQRAGATTGTEYAPVVTSLGVGTCTWTINADGSRVLHVPASWTAPSNASYGGGVVKLIRAGGAHQEIGAGWNSLTWNTGDYPQSNESVTLYVLSTNKNNQRNTYVNGVTPDYAFTLPCPVLGSAGAEYTPNVTGYSAVVTYPATADGTYRAVVTCTFTKPSNVTWAGVAIRISLDGGATWIEQKTVSKSPATFEIPVPTTATAFKVGFFGVDAAGHVNTYQSGVTPTVDINIGNAAGQFDMTKAKATTYDSDIFTIADGKFKIWAMNGSLIVTGSISTPKLDTTEISVGGGGGKPGKFGVYNAAGTQIGFIGVESGYEGGWFKTLGIGGASKSAPKIAADASGNVTFTDGTITVSATISGGVQTVLIDPSATVAPLKVYRTNYYETRMYAGGFTICGNGSTAEFPTVVIERGSGGASVDLYGGETTQPGIDIQVTPSTGCIDLLRGAVLKVGGNTVISAAGLIGSKSTARIISRFFNQTTIPAYSDLSDGEIALWWHSDGNGMNLLYREGGSLFVLPFAGEGYTKAEIDAMFLALSIGYAGTHDHSGQVPSDGDHNHTIS